MPNNRSETRGPTQGPTRSPTRPEPSAIPDDPPALALDRLARLHWEHGMTHQEIADLVGVSRVRVTRRLAEARRKGIVQITIRGDTPAFTDLEAGLVDRFGLTAAWVAPDIDGGPRTLGAVGVAGARCLSEIVPGCRRVAVGPSNAVAAAVDALSPGLSGRPEVIPTSGSWNGPATARNPHELALRLGSAFGGQAYHLPVPLLAVSAEVAASLREDAAIAETLDLAARADLLVAGIGGVSDAGGPLLRTVPAAEVDEIRSSGAVGDISGRFFDRAGRPVRGALDGRLVGLGLDDLRRVPARVAVASGPTKYEALAVALAHGLVTGLVTDSNTARVLLET